MDTVELSPATGGQHIADKPLPHPTTLPKPAIYPRPLVPTEVTTATETVAHISITTTGSSHISKPPPPIPPKPISIPAGLVFSHKPGESVKPPPPPVAPKAATLPRTKAPPSALSLSLTQPVASKQGAASPKSPLSPRHAKCLQTYVVITLPSEPGSPTESVTVQAPVRRGSIPSTKSIESQAIQGPENVVSSMSHMYSSSISTSGQPPESLPSLVTQVVTTEVQRTTVSVVHERHPYVPPPSVAITIQPDIAKVQPLPKQNGKIYPEDIVDLRTMRVGIKMTKQGMDLTPPESCRQSFSNEPSGHQITAVQPEIVNLSPEIIPATTLSVVTDSITIVTCTATIASYNKTPAEKPLDIQGPVTSLPLHLTTYKPFEPLAQIVYRPVKSQSIVRAVTSPMAQDIPINLSFGALVSPGVKQPVTSVPAALSSGGPVLSLEATGAMDLSNYRPARAMVALSGTSPGVVTTIVEDDGAPVDLTAGRRSVCCDVIYKLPFTGSCRTQPPVTSQPDNRFGYRDDHYQYDNAGIYGIKGMNGIKTSMSESNLREAGLFSYDPKNDFDYLSGSSDGAIDLTAARLSAGEYKSLDYTSKATGVYPGMTTAPYSQVPAAGFGVNSVLRTSDGIVYSSVSAQVPSTYAITTQPGSIFSTALTPTSTTVQNQSFSHPYSFIPPTDPEQIIPFDTGLPKELLPRALADIITGYPDMYSDTTLEAIAASLDVLASSPIFPGLDNTKMAQYQVEREFLELEKLKQLCLAEELEWERQEIQRYREQEQFMVQRELEELQALKQQLLLQQEEEHHAHMVAQQETYAQQKEQLQQIQQLQLQLQRQLDEHYGTSGTTGKLIDAKYAGVGDSGQYWPVKDESTTLSAGTQLEESQKLQADQDTGKKIIDSGVQTDDEDSAEKQHVGRKKKNKRNIDSSAQSDDEDQDEWDAPTKARRRSRKHSSDGKHGSKVSSIAIQTVAEISVQTDHSGTIKRPNVQMDTKVEIIKHISAPENSQRGGSLSCQTDSDRRHTIDAGYSTHLTVDAPSKSKVFYSPVSPMSPEKSLGGQRMLTADPTRFSSGPQILKAGHKSLSDPKSLSSTREERMVGYYGRGSPSGTGKKVKRTLPDPPPEDDSLIGRSGYSTNSARRRLARSTTIARAKILQDIDKELDLVERESSKLRKKQAELDEEEKEIDAKLRYLEMGINRRKEALLKEREKRERAYLQGVAEERDYMSDSEVSNIREARGDGMERPRTAPQSEFDQFIPPQTEADSQYNTLTSPYSHYAQYSPQTQTTSHYTQQNLYQQQSLYHQQVSPYTSLSLSHAQAQPSSYQHALLLQQGKQRQTTLSDLEPKITTNYEVIRNQPLLIVPTSTESGYGVAHLGGKYGSLDLRLGLEERSMASSPMSSISADSFYTDIDHHNTRNYVLIEDIGELTKASTGLSNTGLGSGFNLPDKELSKADRLLRAAEIRRTAEVADFLGSSQLQGYSKGEDDTMEEPFELKLLKQQIKQEFRRGTEGLEHLTGLGLPHYLPSDSSFRHFPKGEKYSISRLTLEKQAAKQLPAAVLYQKQMKNKKALIDPKAITKFSPIQESRDLEPDFGSYMGSGASSVTNLAARARLLQDEITFGLRKNLSEQQKYLGSSLGANLAGSLNLGQSLGLASTIRATAQDDGTYPSGTRSRPSSRPSSRPASVYGLDLSIKRDLSSSSLRLKTEGEALDATFAPGVTRAKPTSLPISQSRGRIPIVAQNSEEESPLSPVGQPMGMSRASAGPLPPISADSRDQFGSSHSLPEVQQHMREESRTHGYDRDIAFIMDDLQGAMSDSEAYHLRREDTDWFDKPREGQLQGGSDRRQKPPVNSFQTKLVPYAFPHTRIKLKRDLTDTSVSGNGLGIRVVGGKEIPGSRGEIGAYIAKVIPGGVAEQAGRVAEGMQVMEWNRVPLTGKTYEEVQCIMGQPCAEAELCVRLDLNMLSDPDHPQALEHHVQLKAGGQRSPGVDPKQLAAELQKVSQQQAPVLSALERSALLHSGTGSAASSGVPSPGQPASPAINKKQRHKPTEGMKMPHPITGEIQLQINYDRNLGNLIVHVLQARNLAPRDNDGYSDPFVKVYLLPGRRSALSVFDADNKRRTKYAQKTTNPEWNQTVIYKNIHLEQLKKKTLEVTVWDYDRSSSNDFLGEVLIDLSNTAQLDNTPRWLPLKEQSESIEHSRGDGSHDSPKNSVIKSRSHGIFPDPAKDMQMMPLEKSHSSPGSSKSSSDGQLRSHGPSRSQSKSSVTQAHLEDAGIAIAAAEAAVQQSRLQPRPGHRLGDVSGSVVLSAPSLVGDAYGGLDGEDGAGTGVDSAIFQVPRGKTQVMGEIKVALKKEMKTEGDQLVLEILQCRNITYKFKSPDHLPDLYVKLYVVNVATQKRIIKKKTRVCRHDREPSFNETFRFPLNPTGHSIQLFLVSNGGKFMKKTLIGEAYIWLDKVDMRKRVVSWHKLFVSSTQTNP
uniref:Protein piccolo n=1 Tax=Monopterus albus TaxID=43700 RepID=A0A3Q3IV38_MONAL